jgi:hypothetical protein
MQTPLEERAQQIAPGNLRIQIGHTFKFVDIVERIA